MLIKSDKSIANIAKRTINIESNAIANLANFIDSDFSKVVKIILSSKGRVIITGIGKSANVATKIVAVLNSTGTPSIFMHAADAIHGDLGIIQKDDVVICISKSGNTPEIKVLVPLVKNSGNTLVGLTANKQSYLGRQADYILNCYTEKEACPHDLTPTTSTTAQMVMGDALAICLLELRGFSSDDYAKYHPGGALGKRLYLRVSDLIFKNEMPRVSPDTNVKDVIVEISEKRLGATAVTVNSEIRGIITDGDIRRMLCNNDDFTKLKASDIMTPNPETIQKDAMAIAALKRMEQRDITQLLVVNDDNSYEGVVHLHDLIKEGIF